MSKFKKGDRVRAVREHGYQWDNAVGVVDLVNSEDSIGVRWDGVHGRWWFSSGDLVRDKTSPIREKTVKEIVPGRYGLFTVGSCHGGFVEVVQGKNGSDEMMSASELRDAARIFTDLAAYLESKEAE